MPTTQESTTMDLREFVKPSDLATEYGVSTWTVHRWIREGYVPAYRLSGTGGLRIRRSDLAALMERRAPTPRDRPEASGAAG